LRVDANLLSVPPGEKSKTRKTKERVEDRLLMSGAERNSTIFGFGGGVIGDLAGFVAATLHRGVPYVQIPTTLLAQVDSSIGGKVAVDHPLGKNLIGAFYQPKEVYIVAEFLATLPDREFRNGMAEVIKYAAIMDKTLFVTLEKNVGKILKRETRLLFPIVRRCCCLKKTVVELDEKESGLRRILNFGHTIAHALERMTSYRISHGEAVAIGMVAETKISASHGLLSVKECARLQRLVRAFGLPSDIPRSTDLRKLLKETLSDKKLINGVVHYTLLRQLGKAEVGIPLTTDEALHHLQER
jgi:3-dehydroquinate synthase